MAYSSWSVVLGEQPSAAKWNILGTNDAHFYSFLGDNTAWQSWVPTWTNLTVSGSTVVAKYTQVGKTVHFRIRVTLGGGNVPSGSVTYSFPVTAASEYSTDGIIIGHVSLLDTGSANYVGSSKSSSTTAGIVLVGVASATYDNLGVISSTVPHTWANTDVIAITGTYEAA